jgi:hypothetical protein
MTDPIILTNEQFSKIFNNAYAVVIDGCICDVYNDYENEDGQLCTAFVESNDSNYEVAYTIPREIEEGRVSYNPRYKEFYFEDARGEIPSFKILSVASID